MPPFIRPLEPFLEEDDIEIDSEIHPGILDEVKRFRQTPYEEMDYDKLLKEATKFGALHPDGSK